MEGPSHWYQPICQHPCLGQQLWAASGAMPPTEWDLHLFCKPPPGPIPPQASLQASPSHPAAPRSLTLGNLSHAPPDAPRTWLPPETQKASLPFLPPVLPQYPPDHHPPPRTGQFWVLNCTSAMLGGIDLPIRNGCLCLLDESPRPTQGPLWTPTQSMPHTPAGHRLRPIGRPCPLLSTTFSEQTHHCVIVHGHSSAKSGTVLASFPERILPPSRPGDWHWAMAGHAALLGALRRTVIAVSLFIPVPQGWIESISWGPPPKWEGITTRFATHIWDLDQQGIARRGRQVWDLWWRGETQSDCGPRAQRGAAQMRAVRPPFVRPCPHYLRVPYPHSGPGSITPRLYVLSKSAGARSGLCMYSCYSITTPLTNGVNYG